MQWWCCVPSNLPPQSYNKLDLECASTSRWYGGCKIPQLNNNFSFGTIHRINRLVGVQNDIGKTTCPGVNQLNYIPTSKIVFIQNYLKTLFGARGETRTPHARTYRILLWTGVQQDWHCIEIMRWPCLISKNLCLQRLTNQSTNRRFIMKHDQLPPKTKWRRWGGTNSSINPVFSWDPRKVTFYSNIAARPTNKTNKKQIRLEGGVQPHIHSLHWGWWHPRRPRVRKSNISWPTRTRWLSHYWHKPRQWQQPMQKMLTK